MYNSFGYNRAAYNGSVISVSSSLEATETAVASDRISQFDISVVETAGASDNAMLADEFGNETAQVADIGGLGGIEQAGASDLASLTVDIPALPRFPDIPSPMFPVVLTPSFDVGVIPYVDGSEQRVLGIDEVRLKIGLQYKYLDSADKETILAFFIARKGKAKTFYWVNPENSIPYIVRFQEDILNVEYFRYELWNFAKVGFVETFWRSS